MDFTENDVAHLLRRAGFGGKPAFVGRYGGVSDSAFVGQAYHDLLGGTAPSTFRSTWTAKLVDHSATRADVMATLSELPANIVLAKPRVDVLMTYAGMLRRSPEPSGYAYWVAKLRSGTSSQRLIAQFFTSGEYRGRFAAM